MVSGVSEQTKIKSRQDRGSPARRSSDLTIVSQPALDGVLFPAKDKVHCLRALLDPALLMDAQAMTVAWGAVAHFWLVHQSCPFLTYEDLATIIHALITSQLNY